MRSLTTRPGIRLLLLATVVSLVGDSLLIIVLGIWVNELTGSAGAAGLTFLFLALPALLAPFLGVVIDRSQRKSFLVAANMLTGLSLLPLLLVDSRNDIWLVYLVAFAYGVSLIAIPSALNGLLQEMLPEDLLADANSFIQTVKESLRLVGPLAGSLLYATLGASLVVLIDLATFIAAAGGFAALSVQARRREPEPVSGLTAEIMAGGRFLNADPPLRRMLVAVGASFLVFGFAESVVFALTDALSRPPEFVGVLFALQGVGAVVGGVLAGRAVHKAGELGTTALGLLAIAVGMALAAFELLPLTFTGMVIAGLGPPLVLVALFTLVQVRTPAALIGRASAAVELVIGIPQALSIALGALLIGILDYRVLLGAMAAVTLVAAGALVLLAPTRSDNETSAT